MIKFHTLKFWIFLPFCMLVFCLASAQQAADSPAVEKASEQPLDPVVAPAAQPAQQPDAESAQLQERLQKKISLDLRDMNIVDVLKFLAIKGSFNIVNSKLIEGRVTLLLTNVAIADALDIILIANDLAYIKKHGIIYVMSGDEYLAMYGKKFSDNTRVKIVYLKYARPSYVLTALQNIRSAVGKIVIDEDTGTVVMIDTEEKLAEMQKAIAQMEYKTETKVITLKYAKAQVLAEQLKVKLDAKAVGNIGFDERSNQVIVTALPERMKEIEDVIKALDTKTKAVLLEMRILQVTLKPQYDMGINWEVAFKNSKHETLRSLDFASSFPSASTAMATTLGKIAVGNINFDNIAFELNALKQVSSTKLLANPRIMVVNNEEAKIHIGDTRPYVTTTTLGTGDTATTTETVNWINIGIQLLVTPTINDDGVISIKLKPEISSKIEDYLTPKQAKIPIVNTTLVETTVLAKDGNTIIIGGLVKNDKLATRSGIPGLMSIPLVGGLFRNESDTITNSEIVIFLTPHIVTGDTELSTYQDEKIMGMKGE
ncbi:MAG: hypothetical protein MUF05_07565 [Candidatus Omnitrophica bacterium]|jgi:type II secretory pathway component GspD/PulD (secretin)|nr:hypothetical protein [Candidatus Omnitrophota bacterium]